eukprot:1157319-Pelagomonas_calceolata.AAC.2
MPSGSEKLRPILGLCVANGKCRLNGLKWGVCATISSTRLHMGAKMLPNAPDAHKGCVVIHVMLH